MATASAPAVHTPAMVAAMTQAAEVPITIDDFAYAVSGPVTAGATVTVVHNDDVPHTGTDVNGAFDSGILAAGETGTFTAPQEPGEYALKCTIDPSMSGMLMVKAADGAMYDGADGGSSASEDGDMDSDSMAKGGTGQQISPMPEGGADTGVAEQGNASNLGVLALGGGLVLVAAGGTYALRRRSSDRA